MSSNTLAYCSCSAISNLTFLKKNILQAKIYRQFQLVSFVIYKQPTFECNTNSSYEELVADFWPYFSDSSIWKFLAWCTMSDPSCYKCFIRHRVVFYSKHASEHEFTMNLPPSGILIAISCKLRFLGERANSSANFVKLISRMSKGSHQYFHFSFMRKILTFWVHQICFGYFLTLSVYLICFD